MNDITTRRTWTWLGALLIVVGFFGHFFAARAISSNPRAYPDHIGGFFLILLVTGTIIALLGRRFWKGRNDITLLIIGIVQAGFGIWIYINRFHLM